MEDLTLKLKNITQEYFIKNPITEQEWSSVKCTLFMDRNNDLYFVGHIRSEEYPVYVVKATIDECKDKEILSQIKSMVEEHSKKRMIYHSIGSGASCSFHKGTYGLVHNNKITLGVLYKFPNDYSDIKWLINDAKRNAELYSEIIDWHIFSDKMDKLDERTKNLLYGIDAYPSLSEFHHLITTDFSFMALSNDEFARKQYERFIGHLYAEFQAKGALR